MPGRVHLPSGLVTFLFTDIEGSTRLAQMLGPGYRPVLTEHRRLLRATLAARGGVELFTEGDSFFVAFEDASAAVDACVTAQRALAAHDWPTPDADAPGPDGPAHRPRRAARRRVRQPRGAPGRPDRRRRPRRPGALLGRDRAPRRPAARRGARCSTSACTGCAASTTGSACSSSSRPAWSASSRARAPSTRRSTTCPPR